LVCIPWAGAGAAPFRSWAPFVGKNRRIYAARLAGREGRVREPVPASLESVVSELAEAVAELPADRVDLFGHCSGAIIAFELARALRTRSSPVPRRLIVAGQVAPRRFAASAPAVNDAQRYVPEDVLADEELTRLLMGIVQADLAAFTRYSYAPGDPLDMPITALRGGHDSYIDDGDLQSWAEESTRTLTCVRVDEADALFTGTAWGRLAEEVLQALQ
jgi:surfactin synthase thioesterase subunit